MISRPCAIQQIRRGSLSGVVRLWPQTHYFTLTRNPYPFPQPRNRPPGSTENHLLTVTQADLSAVSSFAHPSETRFAKLRKPETWSSYQRSVNDSKCIRACRDDDISIVNLLPAYKTAKITRSQKQFGASVVINPVNLGVVGGNLKHSLQSWRWGLELRSNHRLARRSHGPLCQLNRASDALGTRELSGSNQSSSNPAATSGGYRRRTMSADESFNKYSVAISSFTNPAPTWRGWYPGIGRAIAVRRRFTTEVGNGVSPSAGVCNSAG